MKKQKTKKNKRKSAVVKPAPAVDKTDKFIDDETPINADDAYVVHPNENDVRDVLRDLDGFRDWQQESRGNGLTYGDY